MELLHAELRGEPAVKMEESTEAADVQQAFEGEFDEVVADW